MVWLLKFVLVSLLLTLSYCKTVTFISNSKAARDNRGTIVTKFTFHGKQALARLRGNDSIGGFYFFPRDKILAERSKGECNQFLRKASFSLFPKKSNQEYKERKFSLWSQEPHTFYALFVDAATCYPQYPTQGKVELELHLVNDPDTGGHLSAEEKGLKVAHVLLLLLFTAGCVWFGMSLYSILSSGGPVLLVMQLFLACSGLQGLTLLIPTLHWVSYESNGWGWPFLNSLTSITSLAADLAMIGLVVDIILGWTLGSCRRMTTSKSEMVFRVVAVLGILQVVFHFYTVSLDTSDPTYYPYSSLSEILQGLILAAEGCYFLAILAGTYQEDRSALRQDFYSSFAWIIITWYAAHPVSQLIVLFMAEYNRLKVFVAITQFLRGCGLAQLANLLIRRSLFWEVSSLSATSIPFAERSFAPQNDANNQTSGYGYQQGYDKLYKRN